jgi:Fis family transcriptional regulator
MPATMHYYNDLRDNELSNMPLRDQVKNMISNYYQNMETQGSAPEKVYELVMAEVELPLIEATMEYTNGNQSQAAKILGINRGTFRKKLLHYGIL